MPEFLSFLPLDWLGAIALATVFLSMVALGASAEPARVAALDVPTRPLLRALGVALVAVPLGALAFAALLGVSGGPLVGILLMGISPGAPLALRKSRDEGADSHFALQLQVTVALLAIVAVPLWLLVLSALYGRPAGVSFVLLAKQVFVAQILPLGLGVAFAKLRPDWAHRLARPLLRIAGLLVFAVAVVLLAAVAPRLSGLPWQALLASCGVTLVAIGLGSWAAGPDPQRARAGSVICALRNPGIAFLIASANGFPPSAKFMIIAHVLVTAVLLGLFLAASARLARLKAA